jgi:hypothetical protein
VATLSALVIEGKIKNQRATLLYFKKYQLFLNVED